MFLLALPALHTPLLKVPILLSCSALTYLATGVPNVSHPQSDRKMVDADFMTRSATLQIALAKVTMVGLEPMGLKKETGSFDSGGIKMYQYGHMAKEETNIREVPSPSRFILNTRMAPW